MRATIHPLDIIGPWSVYSQGSIVALILPPLCFLYYYDNNDMIYEVLNIM